MGLSKELTIIVKRIKRGYAGLRKSGYKVVIPQWAMDRSEEYGIYYICHELAHIMCFELFESFAHIAEFKMIEDEYLADFGLVIKRKKAYPKTLTALAKLFIEARSKQGDER